MNEKVTQLLLNILKYLLSLLLGLYLAVIVTGSIMAFSQYKLEIGNHFKEVILSLSLIFQPTQPYFNRD